MAIAPTILCGLKCLAIKKHDQKMSVAKMRMLRQMNSTLLEDKNECIHKKLGVALIEMFWYVQWRVISVLI